MTRGKDKGAGLDRRKAVGFLVAAAVLLSLGGLLIKWVDWNPMAIAGTRSAIAAIVLLVILRRPHFTWSFVQIGGALAYAATVISYVVANRLTTAANTILLQFTAPLYVALLGEWFLGEKTTKLDWILIFIVISGMILFFIDSLTAGGLWGNLCAIASGICLAWLTLFLRKQKEDSPVESILLGNIIAALVSLPLMLKSSPSWSSWVGLILLGVFQLGLPFALYSIALKYVKALEAMLISVIEPILNPLWVFFLMGESPGKWALLGGVIVLASVTLRGIITARGRKIATRL